MSSNGRKIKSEYDSIIDDWLIELCEPVSEPLHKMSFTPNMITTIGLLFGILSIFFFYKRLYLLSFVSLWICYWFDCLDGYYARKYNMETQFGDYYDHFRDLFVCITIGILIMIRLRAPYRYFFIASICISCYLAACQMGCQEKNSDYKEANQTLTILEQLCPSRDFIDNTRIAGCGVIIIVLSFFIMIAMMTDCHGKHS